MRLNETFFFLLLSGAGLDNELEPLLVESLRSSSFEGEDSEVGESMILEAADEVDVSENIESTELRMELEIDKLCWCLLVGEAWIKYGLVANAANSM